MQIGTFVHYSTKGICQVREIETMKFSSETKDYYVLVPVFDRNSKYYVPTDGGGIDGLCQDLPAL